MQRQILLLAITAAALSSCTTAYKTGQTPADVYFLLTRPQDEYVRVKEKEDYQYRYDDNYYDDRYLRMKVHNPSQWSALDDWYAYGRNGYMLILIIGTYYNPYTSWNYYYNPYCHNNVIAYNTYNTGHPGQTIVAQNVPKPRNFNLASYTNINNYNNANSGIKMNSYKTGMAIPVYNNRNSNNGFSNTLKQIFNTGSNNNNDNSSYSSPSRSYSPSSSSSSSGGSSGSSGSSGGGGATRPSRGGN